jgi:hypothetical protein
MDEVTVGSSDSGRLTRSPSISRCLCRRCTDGGVGAAAPRATGSETRSAIGRMRCAPGSTRTLRRPSQIMGRSSLVIGSWGLIRTYPVGEDPKGKPVRHLAIAKYRDYDGRVRQVEASGER